MQLKKTTLKTISPTKHWNKILCAIFLKVITCASILTKYNLVWHIYIIMLIITFITHCSHYQHSDWPRAPSLFWEFTWFCGQAWLEYNLLSKGAFVWEYSGIRMYSGIYSGYSAPGSRIARMESRYSGMRIAPKQTLICVIPIILIPDWSQMNAP